MSDDILLACWKYEEVKSKHKLKENRIWEAIEKELLKVFSQSKNNRSWYWFEMYLWKSAVTSLLSNVLQCTFLFSKPTPRQPGSEWSTNATARSRNL